MEYPLPVEFTYAGHYHKNDPVPVHAHDGVELTYVSRGACVTRFYGGIEIPGKVGTVYVAPPGLAHDQKNLDPACETYYTVMKVSADGPDGSLRTIDASGDELIDRWFHDLYTLDQQGAREQASALLLTVWSRLLAIERARQADLPRHPALVRALRYLEKHFQQPVAVSELARYAGVSQSHLNALFRQETGGGAEAFLTSLRMKMARQLLLNRYYSIAEVAERCGCPDANYFSRRFRLFHGISPREYRSDPDKIHRRGPSSDAFSDF